MKAVLHGVDGHDAFFRVGDEDVLVNTRTLTASVAPAEETEFSRPWYAPAPADPVTTWAEVAECALEQPSGDVTVISSGHESRAFTIPKAVSEEARRGLRWRAETGRGGTALSLHVARLLASGGQVGVNDVRHVYRFFNPQESVRGSVGWRPSEPDYPSGSRITWSMWGGDAGFRWARGVVDKLPLTASTDPEVNLLEFYDDDRLFWAERVAPDSDEVHALFTRTSDDVWQLWANGQWEPVHQADIDLDRLVELDDDAAVFVASSLYDSPDSPVSLRAFDPEEWDLVQEGLAGVDWEIVDRTLKPEALRAAAGDGDYTPEERAKNAQGQPRDAGGRFARIGDYGETRGGIRGRVMTVNPVDQTLIIEAEDGNVYAIPSRDFKIQNEPQPAQAPTAPIPPLNLDKILGQPRVTATTPKAWLNKLLPPMNAAALKQVVSDYEGFIQQERMSRAGQFRGGTPFRESRPRPKSEIEQEREWREDWEDQRGRIAAAVAMDANKPTPDNTDVPPIYMAIVDRDDPRAVTDLVALVPAADTGNEATAFRRVGGSWVEDVKVLQDMRSPTPPPVVKLDEDTYTDVLSQVDAALPEDETAPSEEDDGQPVTAAGGADRNRGNAEKLRRYWTVGPGAAKIRWGTHGDFDRCVSQLSKYMGPRAKGYCNLRHKEVVGNYPPEHHKPHENTNDDQWAPAPAIAEIMEEFRDLPDDEYDEALQKDKERLVAAGVSFEPVCIPMWAPDGSLISLVAAGGADRNRGNAERLRRYWLYGPGAAKIRWGTGGDWYRCVRQLSKHMGVRAKGYCALRHKEATGMWTGDQEHRALYSTAGVPSHSSTDALRRLRHTLLAGADVARANVARRRIMGETDVVPVHPREITGERTGAAFHIPLVIPEDVESGDGRKFDAGALTTRQMPIPLLWQIQTGEGHNGSVLVGRIDRVERTPDGLGNAFGVFDIGPYGQEAERLVRERMLQWVSADLDQFEAAEELAADDDEDPEAIKNAKLRIKKARLMGVTLVPKPAFQECTIELVPDGEVAVIEDGSYVSEPADVEAAAIVAAGSTALKIPTQPPKDWFDNPRLGKATPLTVTDDGRVFGHIAAWNVDHIGMPFGTRAPRSASGYAYFHTGVLKTADGDDVPVGQLTLAGGHAPLEADAAMAVKHYDDTASAIADVHAGEDSFGIWVSGALRPSVTPEQIRSLRASAPSGDWRVINGRLELVAVCQVNVPGFPITRAQVASGHVHALVAAGASTLARMRKDPLREIDARVRALEEHDRKRDALRADAAKQKLYQVREERSQKDEELRSLAASARARVYKVMGVDGYLTEFKDFPAEKREKLAKEKKALPDGSFPIESVADLRRAIRAYGRAEESKKAKVRRHIVRRARGLDKPDLIPKDWKEASLNDLALNARDARETLTAAAEARQQQELQARAAAAASRFAEIAKGAKDRE